MNNSTTSAKRQDSFFLVNTTIQQIVADGNNALKFVPNANATPQRAREMMIASGIDPKDNLGSCGIIAARDEN
jgi:hypothetical protein